MQRQVQADIRTHLILRPARDIIPPLGGFSGFLLFDLILCGSHVAAWLPLTRASARNRTKKPARRSVAESVTPGGRKLAGTSLGARGHGGGCPCGKAGKRGISSE